jgi:hypothetical protein
MDMNAQVEKHLGDSISIELSAGAFTPIQGFVSRSNDGLDVDGISPIRARWHVKILQTAENVALLPAGPASIRRLTSSILDTVYKPAAGTIADDGTAWSFDLQKARD